MDTNSASWTALHVSEAMTWLDFGAFLQRLRRRRGISQEKLASMLQCHRTYIWRLEHGRNRPSSIFLHSLKATCSLNGEEVALLEAFEQMRRHHCDEIDPSAT